MRRHGAVSLIGLAGLFLLTWACAAPHAAQRDTPADGLRPTPQLQPGANYVLAYLLTNRVDPGLDADARRTALAGHFENMGRLAQEGVLVVAGPLGEPRSNPAQRGIFILDSADPPTPWPWRRSTRRTRRATGDGDRRWRRTGPWRGPGSPRARCHRAPAR